MLKHSLIRASPVGISGFSVYVPPYRVDLEKWCRWSGNEWNKIRNVIGTSFRVPGPQENVYTMAANAALDLILKHDVDPQQIGFIGLGTESSTDNSAGAVIIKGMLDKALLQLGLPQLPKSVEVPEFKHACLGGIYAMKNACRFVDGDPRERKAIVVAADIAEYERGSTGEPTQGAGAVAMLVDSAPLILEVKHRQSGSSSAYRGPDFRKPVSRHFSDAWATNTSRHSDFPVFSGPYSTTVYTDTTISAVEDMLQALGLKKAGAGTYFEELAAIFMHRPYRMMPQQAMSYLYVRGLVRSTDPKRQRELAELCEATGVTITDLVAEVSQPSIDPYEVILATGQAPVLHKLCGQVAKGLRSNKVFKEMVAQKMTLGNDITSNLGNLYSASLPAWLAAGVEEAAAKDIDLTGKDIVGIGYGSGDAAEALPLVVRSSWKKAALKAATDQVLERQLMDLTQEQYEGIHDTRSVSFYPPSTVKGFFIERVGSRNEPAFQDLGVEYYGYNA